MDDLFSFSSLSIIYSVFPFSDIYSTLIKFGSIEIEKRPQVISPDPTKNLAVANFPMPFSFERLLLNSSGFKNNPRSLPEMQTLGFTLKRC